MARVMANQTQLFELSYNPGFEFVELAEVFHLLRVVAVEEYLVETGKAEYFLVTVELDLYRDDASAGWWHFHIVKNLAG